MDNGPWTDTLIERLRGEWADGTTAAEIARRLNMSKNAVVGKAHRLHLTPRPSPIKAGGSKRAILPRMVRQKPTLAALKSVPKAETIVMAAAAPLRRIQKSEPCCWPMGEPRSNTFRYCDAAGVPGKPYCQTHCEIAFTPVTIRNSTINKLATL